MEVEGGIVGLDVKILVYEDQNTLTRLNFDDELALRKCLPDAGVAAPLALQPGTG